MNADNAGDIVRDSLSAAIKELKHYVGLVNRDCVNNINEAVFRFWVLAEIMRRAPAVRCETEWNKFDLLVMIEERTFVIEFKFYFGYSKTHVLPARELGRWKGGASLKNEQEFHDCLEKLRNLGGSVDGKYLVLVYTPGPWTDHERSFENSYDNLERFGIAANEVERINHCYEDRVVCKLIAVK